MSLKFKDLGPTTWKNVLKIKHLHLIILLPCGQIAYHAKEKKFVILKM